MRAQCVPIETMPAKLKINEKPRKYHFFPSQSTFTLRNNSTGSLPFLGGWSPGAPAFLCFFPCRPGLPAWQLPYRDLDGHQVARLHLVQVGIENDPRDVDRREEVGS